MPGRTTNEPHATALGAYLAAERAGRKLSLREVEEATDRQVSNGYLSQLENGKINKPSPHVLYALAKVYAISYERLMERAGYLVTGATDDDSRKHGNTATFAVENLTHDEEHELLKYLAYLRSKIAKK